MKRFFILILVSVSIFGGLIVSAGVNDFSISNFEIDYYLEKDSEDHSLLTVTENITADFPNFKQNKGLVREIPSVYDGHKLPFTLISLERNGVTEPIYTNHISNKHHIIETGTDEYVLGPQTYTFIYKLNDVTRYFKNTNHDEFYWDTNGIGWRVPIDNLSVNLHIHESLKPKLTNDIACYQGESGSTDACQIIKTDTGYSVNASNLKPYENVTIAIGFLPGTFAEYEQTLGERFKTFMVFSIVIGSIISIIFVFWTIYRRVIWSNRKKEITTIIPEYFTPSYSVTASSNVLDYPRSVFVAQILDFAVRGFIKIIETKGKTFWRTKKYSIEITGDLHKLQDEEKEILSDMFGSLPAIGKSLNLDTLQNNLSFFGRIQDNHQKLKDLIINNYHLRQKDKVKTKKLRKPAKWLLILGILTINPVMLLSAGLIYLIGLEFYPLSDEGLKLRRYLEGLKLYISIAETDRIKMLQSPEGAEKISIDTNNTSQIIKLYEKLLPYAVLFNKEKEWNNQLGKYYETTHSSPNWYSGTTSTVNAATFGSMINSFSSAVSSTSAGSSGSGGSGGGGSSGGGGGGGRGGGR